MALRSAYAALNNGVENLWRWWNLPVPRAKRIPLASIIEVNPTGVEWHTAEETEYLLSLMNGNNLGKVEKARRCPGQHIGFVYKRIREGVQRAEVRFDGIAGCLRTPKGGSSRQTVLIVDNGALRSRLLSPREAARLMGAGEFKLPEKYNDAYKAMGDGVVVPVVRWLANELLTPLAAHVEASLERGSVRAGLHPAAQDFRRSSERRAAEWLMSMPSKSVSSHS
jgi:DNA (cytosine-5)-methyltransferase 1